MHIPTLIISFLGILILLFVGYFSKKIIARRRFLKELAYFDHMISQLEMNQSEILFLQTLMKKEGIRSPLKIINDEACFERVIRPHELIASPDERSLIRHIRVKLFDKSPVFAHQIRSTNEIPLGCRIFIQYEDNERLSLWGELNGIEKDGLLIIIQAAHVDNEKAYWIFDTNENDDLVVLTEQEGNYHILLKHGTRIKITVQLPDNQSIVFRTRIESFVPGPSKMAVLKHSDEIIKSHELLQRP
jgi:hypothetical protein